MNELYFCIICHLLTNIACFIVTLFLNNLSTH